MPDLAPGCASHLAEIGGAGADGNGKDGQHHGRFRNGGEGHLAAAAHAAKGAARVEPSQSQKEPSKREQTDDGQHAAKQAQRALRSEQRHHQARRATA